MTNDTLVLPGLVHVDVHDRLHLREAGTQAGQEFREIYHDELIAEAQLSQSTRSLDEGYLLLAILNRLDSLGKQWDSVCGVSTGISAALVYSGSVKSRDAFAISRELTTLQGRVLPGSVAALTLLVVAPSEAHFDNFVQRLQKHDLKPQVGVRLDHQMAAVSFLWPNLDELETLEKYLAKNGLLVLEVLNGAEHCSISLPPPSHVSRLYADVTFENPHVNIINPADLTHATTAAEIESMAVKQWHTPIDLSSFFAQLCRRESGRVTVLGPKGSIYETFTRPLAHLGGVTYLNCFEE